VLVRQMSGTTYQALFKVGRRRSRPRLHPFRFATSPNEQQHLPSLEGGKMRHLSPLRRMSFFVACGLSRGPHRLECQEACDERGETNRPSGGQAELMDRYGR